ncbi:hypothetical protein JOL79_15595 [Microbispora sp. RL4-1S]|uniref:Uncharacterized protein n=1 Tax=Microbispora oryzae TaxID=2806554 RepID=A0A940WPN7_9ACTN|nr:hypothetical protein [Microbispora oryzae]MBP2705240.1 hypothetical protein [Microbispora oryzae]
MLAIMLGLSWLVLTPVCVWLLFGPHRSRPLRGLAVFVLTSLQATTMVLGFAEQAPRPAPSVLARSGAATTPETVAGAGGSAGPDAAPAAPLSPQDATDAASGCASRVPVPEAVRLSLRGRILTGVTVYWPAAVGECDVAAVALRHAGGRLRLWVHEGTPGHHRKGARTLPVRVTGDTASLDVRLTRPIRHHAHLVAVNGHTGRVIRQKPRPAGM